MDIIPDSLKLKWLTTRCAPRVRAMVDENSLLDKDSLQAIISGMTPLQRQIQQPSFGNLGKLPPELLCMVFGDLTCNDLEALHSCSTGLGMAVLAFPQYHRLLKHIPNVLAILKETRLARSFTITQLYETFVSPLCTSCGQFGGYVFLLSFTRCCIHCAETELKFLPISRDGARKEFGVKGKKIFDSLPQLHTIPGNYNSFYGETTYYKRKLALFSRELVQRSRNPEHNPSLPRYSQEHVDFNFIQAHQRYMALTTLPCYVPRSGSIEEGLYCAGCNVRAREHVRDLENLDNFCEGKHLSEYSSSEEPLIYELGLDVDNFPCSSDGPQNPCRLTTAQDRKYDSRHILSHLQGCEAAQALLKLLWTRRRNQIRARNLRHARRDQSRENQ